ncbi:CsbD family protein [Halomonas sp. DQ26W]|uniref:CsbD family protein n=1 Tax=Halomonas sp. DQ26W TaxID=2282311 RepID=UPI000DF84A17|nr:CsbD family protein [Halomonas sp. DQ26W]RDB42941.1 CsbD family protein [Halomonas sp. DQ26W]
MNKDQVKDSAGKDKGNAKEFSDKVSDDKTTEQKGDAEKHGDEDGVVLDKINDDAKKAKK